MFHCGNYMKRKTPQSLLLLVYIFGCLSRKTLEQNSKKNLIDERVKFSNQLNLTESKSGSGFKTAEPNHSD